MVIFLYEIICVKDMSKKVMLSNNFLVVVLF